jgi:hypothetical protein
MLIYQAAGFSRHHFAGGKNLTRKQGHAIFTIASSWHGAEPIEGYLSVGSSIAEPIGFWLFSDLSARGGGRILSVYSSLSPSVGLDGVTIDSV